MKILWQSLALILLVGFAGGLAFAEEPVTDEVLTAAYAANALGNVYEGWKVLAGQGDGYAKTATKIFSETVTLEGCIVRATWDTVVGVDVRHHQFKLYGLIYQKSYIHFLESNRRYPNSLEIEKLYRDADERLNLPESISIDLILNLVPPDTRRKDAMDFLSSLINFGGQYNNKRWYNFTDLSPERVVEEFITAEGISAGQADHLMWKALRKAGSCFIKGAGQKVVGY